MQPVTCLEYVQHVGEVAESMDECTLTYRILCTYKIIKIVRLMHSNMTS